MRNNTKLMLIRRFFKVSQRVLRLILLSLRILRALLELMM